MSNQLNLQEAEAILMLSGSNPKAFDTYISYLQRRYDNARDKCVSTRVDAVQVEQGIARAFREMKDIEEEAESILETSKQR